VNPDFITGFVWGGIVTLCVVHYWMRKEIRFLKTERRKIKTLNAIMIKAGYLAANGMPIYRTTDGGTHAPYPGMTDDQLRDFEKDLDIPSSFDRGK